MPGTTIGRVEYIAGIDGSRLPAEARKIGKEAGALSGKDFNDAFDEKISTLGKNIQKKMLSDPDFKWGTTLGKQIRSGLRSSLLRLNDDVASALSSDEGFRKWSENFGSADEAVDELDRSLVRLRGNGLATWNDFQAGESEIKRLRGGLKELQTQAEGNRDAFRDLMNVRLNEHLDDVTKSVRESEKAERDYKELLNQRLNEVLDNVAADKRMAEQQKEITDNTREHHGWLSRLNLKLDEFSKSMNESNASMEKQIPLWHRLSANTRQWTLIISAIASGGSDIAGLLSAAGAGLVVLGAGAASAIVGIGGLIAVFSGLSGEIDDLPAEVRPAAKAFQSLGKMLRAVQRAIQVAALKNATGAFESLSDTAKALTPNLEKVGEAIGEVIDDFAKGLKPGTKGFKTLAQLVDNAAGNFKKFASIVGSFAQAFGTAFNKAQPYLDQFLNGLGEMGDSFNALVDSDDFDRWMARSAVTLGKLGKLIGAASKAITDLVTPEAQHRLDEFIDNLTEFMPNLSKFLDILGKLDLFGIIAQALNDVGKALEPLAKPMGELFKALNKIVSVAIDEWAKDLKGAAQGVAPLVQGIADALDDIDPEVVRKIADALLALAAAAVIFKGAKGIGGMAAKMKTEFSGFKSGPGKGGATAGLIAGLTAALTTDASNEDNFTTFGDALETSLTTTLNGAVTGALTGFILGGPWGALIGGLFGGTLAAGLNQNISNFFTGLGPMIALQLALLWLQFSSWFGQVATGWQNFLVGIGEGLRTWWDGVVVGWQNFLTDTGTNIRNGFNGFWATIVATITNIVLFLTQKWNEIVAGVQEFTGRVGKGWNAFWGGFGKVVSDIWNTIVDNVRLRVNTIIGFINDMIAAINSGLDAIKDITGGLVNLHIPSIPKTASGGVFGSAQMRIIGEAGPEAVVPLNRPLSQVNPAVRALSAFAQGQGGTSTGPAKIVNVDSGAIVVAGVRNPFLAANAVLDNLVTKL